VKFTVPEEVALKRWKLVPFALLLAASASLGVRAQEDRPVGASTIGRYQPARPAGVLDTASGAAYFVDPEDPKEVVTLDLVHCHAFVREAAKDVSGWGAVDLAKLDPAVVPPARERAFVATGNAWEVLDTKTGALYTLEGPPPKARVADWKGVKVVRTDPVLATRATRDLTVSRRGP
jgi:hypothetical protein